MGRKTSEEALVQTSWFGGRAKYPWVVSTSKIMDAASVVGVVEWRLPEEAKAKAGSRFD